MPDLDKLKKMSNVKIFKENECMFQEGDPGNDMFIILSGKVSVYIRSKENLQIKVTEIEAGGFLGEMSLLEGEPRSATAIATDYTIALAVNKENFEAFVTDQPGMAFKLLKGLSSRIRVLNENLSCLMKGEANPLETVKKIPHENTPSPKQSASLSGGLKELLYPKAHKTYPLLSPDTDIYYAFDKKAQCPICHKEFDVLAPVSSKLRLKSIDPDFRHRYEEFEPLWYNVWVCPHCCFAGNSAEFDIPQENKQKEFTEKNEAQKLGINFKYSQPRSLDEVFTAYYLALYSTKLLKVSPLKSARLWLQLSWLYKDEEDEEMYSLSSENAFNGYYEVLYGNSHIKLSEEQDQMCCLILGELYLLKNNKQEAVRHYHAAIKRSGGSSAYNKQAQDRIYYVKHEMK